MFSSNVERLKEGLFPPKSGIKMKLAISGWRKMSSKDYLHVFQQAIVDLIVTHNQIPELVITGGAIGADALGEAWGALSTIRNTW